MVNTNPVDMPRNKRKSKADASPRRAGKFARLDDEKRGPCLRPEEEADPFEYDTSIFSTDTESLPSDGESEAITAELTSAFRQNAYLRLQIPTDTLLKCLVEPSRTTLWRHAKAAQRKFAQEEEARRQHHSLFHYGFGKKTPADSSCSQSADDDRDDLSVLSFSDLDGSSSDHETTEEAEDSGSYSMSGGYNRQELEDYVNEIRSIRATLQTSSKSQMAHSARYLAVQLYFSSLAAGMNKAKAAIIGANVCRKKGAPMAGPTSWATRQVRLWASAFISTGAIPGPEYGYSRCRSILSQPDVAQKCQDFIRSLPPLDRSVPKLKLFLDEQYPNHNVGIVTVNRYFHAW